MRIISINNHPVNTDLMQGFRGNVKAAIEHYSGSPVKKEAKLNEACALALGHQNSDQMANAVANGDRQVKGALALFQEGICPFSEVPMTEEGQQSHGGHVKLVDGVLEVQSFPRGMSKADQILWVAQQPAQTIRCADDIDPMKGNAIVVGPEPHWHAAIAGYRKQTSNFLQPVRGYITKVVGYWHTDSKDFASLPLAQRLKYETHYELVLMSEALTNRVSLVLYRMFAIGENWQISVDEEVRFHHRHSRDAVSIDSALYRVLVNTVMNYGLLEPNRYRDNGVDLMQNQDKDRYLSSLREELAVVLEDNGEYVENLQDGAVDVVEAMLETFDMSPKDRAGAVSQPWVLMEAY